MKSILSLIFFLAATSAFAEVVQPVGAAPQILIPGAGSTAGANGTFFRSDITIVNLRNSDQNVLLQWLPQPGGTGTAVVITIRALSGIRSADFVHDYLNQSGLGAIIVSGVVQPIVLQPPSPDAGARLFVSSRIWTPQPGTNGTTSQNLSTVPLSTINTPAAAIFGVGGVDSPADYRVNVGIVNVDPSKTQTFIVSYSPTSAAPPVSIPVTLPPMTMQLIGAGTPFGGQQISIANATASPSNLWTAFASTINNVTGDAWSELAVAGTTSQ